MTIEEILASLRTEAQKIAFLKDYQRPFVAWSLWSHSRI